MGDERKCIAITLGDAAGIGPEVIVKTLAEPVIYDICRPVVIGDAGVLSDTVGMLKSPLKINPLEQVSSAAGRPGTIDVLDMKNLRTPFTVGQVSAV